MNVKNAFVAVVVVVVPVRAVLASDMTTQQTQQQTQQAQQAESRAELYRRNLLAAGDVPCRTNASCAALGVAALDAGRIDDAQKLVAMEAALAEATVMQAAEENSPKATSSARARATMALVHQGDVQLRLGALSNARAFYRSAIGRGDNFPRDALLGRAVAAAQARLDAIAHEAEVKGVPPDGARFTHYMFFGAWNSVQVKPVKGRHGVYRIDAEFVYPSVDAAGQPAANLGSLSAYVRFYRGVARVPMTDVGSASPVDATARIANLSAYDKRDDKCLIEFALSAPETLDVRTYGSVLHCGFGHNVSADGLYYLTTGS